MNASIKSLNDIIKDENILKNSAFRKESIEILKAIEDATHINIQKNGQLGTTNHIAEIAGVSIGSVYRYFLSKEMILKFVILKQLDYNRNRFIKLVEENEFANMELLVERFVSESIDIFFERKEFFRILFQQIAALNLNTIVHQNRKNLSSELAEIIQYKIPQKCSLEELENRIYLTINTYISLLEYYLLQKEEPDLKVFKESALKLSLLVLAQV